CTLAVTEASGRDRAGEAVQRLLTHPLLDSGAALKGASALGVAILGGKDLTLLDVNRVMESLQRECQSAAILMGAVTNPTPPDTFSIALLVPQCNRPDISGDAASESVTADSTTPRAGDLDSQLLNRRNMPRPQSRFVPPPPSLTPEKMHQLLAR